jgi:hypothetical protein
MNINDVYKWCLEVCCCSGLPLSLSPPKEDPPKSSKLDIDEEEGAPGSENEFQRHWLALVAFLSMPNAAQAAQASPSFQESLVLFSDIGITVLWNRLISELYDWTTDCYIGVLSTAQLANLAYYIGQKFHEPEAAYAITARDVLHSYLLARLDNTH